MNSLVEEQLYALVEVAAGAAGAHRLEDVLELAAERALAAVGAASLSISRWQGGEVVTLINVGHLGPGEERFPHDERYPLSAFPTTLRVLAEGGKVVCAVNDPASDPAHRELLSTLGKESSLTVPIIFEGQTWGELWATTGSSEPRFVERDAVFVRAVADQIAAAIGRAELFAQVEALAYTDPLTRLANRRALEDALERACLTPVGPGSPAVLLCDIDGLKLINDYAGHEAGDQAIRTVAAALTRAAARHHDAVVARMGGDEFCLLLPTGDVNAALAVAKAAAGRLAAADQGQTTISCGIAAHGAGQERPGALLRAADQAQYQAKRAGPNKTAHIAGREPSGSLPRPATHHGQPRTSSLRSELAAEVLALLAAHPRADGLQLRELLYRHLTPEAPQAAR